MPTHKPITRAERVCKFLNAHGERIGELMVAAGFTVAMLATAAFLIRLCFVIGGHW